MQKHLFLIIFLIINSFCYSNNVINIKLNSKKTRTIFVEISELKLNKTSELFLFPSVALGMYEKNDFGNYVMEMKVIYRNGKIKKAKRKDINSFIIENARDVDKIQYLVKETGGDVFSPGGTIYENNLNYLLNFHAIIGYFSSLQYSNYTVNIEKPKHITGIGSLDITNNSTTTDIITASNYKELIDSPFLYSYFEKNDTCSIFLNQNQKIQIAVMPNKFGMTANSTLHIIEPVLEILTKSKLFKNLFPKKYCFIFCFNNKYSPITGALEHNKSSVFFLNDNYNIKSFLINTISHELIHILSPLHIRSNLIEKFNHNHPKFSKHLWLYEGVTEYLSLKCNLNAGLIDTLAFFKKLKYKSNKSMSFEKQSLTKVSENILDEKNQEYYTNFYNKGALIGFLLDYEIANFSNGQKGINDLLMFLLFDDDNNEKIFSDNNLIENIVSKFPETEKCFNNYVQGVRKVPIDKYFDSLGVSIVNSNITELKTTWDFGINRVVFRNKKSYLIIKNQPFNKKISDKKIKILSVNGTKINFGTSKLLFSPKNGDTLKILIKNKLRIKEMNISPQVKYYEKRRECILYSYKSEYGERILNKILSF